MTVFEKPVLGRPLLGPANTRFKKCTLLLAIIVIFWSCLFLVFRRDHLQRETTTVAEEEQAAATSNSRILKLFGCRGCGFAGFPCICIFPLHVHSFRDFHRINANTFGMGLLFLMKQAPSHESVAQTTDACLFVCFFVCLFVSSRS